MALLDVLSTTAQFGRSLLIASQAVDVVAITDDSFSPLFGDARPLTASVYELSDLMEHPLETGAVIADHIVFKPIEISLPMVCVGELAYRSTYEAIKQTFKAGTLLTVTTRTGSYPNMVILEMPHDETPDEMDAVALNIRLREANFVTPQSAALPENSTTNRGTQQTTNTNASDTNSTTNQYNDSGQGDPQGSKLHQWIYG